MDDGDARPRCLGRTAKTNRLSAKLQFSFVVANDARQAFHQRALAGAVLAHEGVQLAATNLDRNAGQRHHAGEPFRDLPDGDHGSINKSNVETPDCVIAAKAPSRQSGNR